MSQPTFFVPIAFARTGAPHTALRFQDPQNRSDQPTGGSTQGGAPAGGNTTTQTGDPNAAGGGAGGGQPPPGACMNDQMLWMMPIFLVLMWLFMIRPEQKRRKEQQALLSSVKQGDRVVMLSGMHGVVSRLTDKTVTLRIDTIEVTFDRSSIQRIDRDEVAAPAKS